jgi:ribose transport system permease protein
LYIFQSKTYLGRAISLTGGNKTAARLAGISIKRSIMSIYVISGMMTAIGAIIYFSRVTTASPVLGNGFETNAILAVVLGGASLAGGKGNVLRTALGTFMVILLANCMNLLGASTYVQYLMRGAVLIMVVLLDKRK